MKNRLCSFLSRLVLPGLVALIVLMSSALMRADAITTFGVSGFANNFSGGTLDSCPENELCAFSGTFRVDTTKGTLESSGFDITFPGLPAFARLVSPVKFFSFRGGGYCAKQHHRPTALFFLTFPISGSLVGYKGGPKTVVPGVVISHNQDDYLIDSGSITPVPEPSSVILFASGLLVLGLITC